MANAAQKHMNSLLNVRVRYELDSNPLGGRASRQPCTVARTSSSPGSSGNIGCIMSQIGQRRTLHGEDKISYWEFLGKDFFTVPPALLSFYEEFQIAMC